MNSSTETITGSRNRRRSVAQLFRVSMLSLAICIAALAPSCGHKLTDLGSLTPAETLVYLETNDLGAALQPIVDSEAFGKAATRKPHLSSLKGIQLAVAITGFETEEEKLTEETSVGRVQPHFVAIADTHAWDFQTVGFVEQKLGAFVADIYDGAPVIDKTVKGDGKYFIWTAKDGRKAYALVIGSIIFFGNDETAIDKCMSVRRGESESLAKSGRLDQNDKDVLASGYISTDGIAQIAGIVGLKLAAGSDEAAEVQSSIAAIVPQLIRSWIKEVKWTAAKTNQGMEDRWRITMPAEVASIFSETMAPSDAVVGPLLLFAPTDPTTVAQYNLRNPQAAWRSVVLTAQKAVDPAYAPLIGQFAGLFFEPYGYKDGEMFLNSIQPGVVTVKYEAEEESAVIAKLKDRDTANRSMDEQFMKMPGSTFDASGPGFDGVRVSGDPAAVLKCGKAQQSGRNMLEDGRFGDAAGALPSIRTLSRDKESASLVADLLSEKKSDVAAETQAFTETRFTKTGVDRRTVSDFGFIGWVLEQLAAE